MIKSMVSGLALAVCLSAFATPVFSDEMAQVRMDCEDEVAGYGIENPDEMQLAVTDCIALRTGSGSEGSND